ncbi:MAG TPA: carboxypeptidase regulatory-like domain-containing protein [Gemmatimonadaceae bacterium]|jgi:hypothetical protein|nr:carboxypeptidase regulatory-like domain-containing protein [Gemmatimonadaceae bacterium]
MPYHRWADALGAMSRREFLAKLGATGVAVVGVAACGGSDGNGGGGIVEPPPTGSITGLVETLDGTPQPNLGTLILMTGRGQQTGQRTSPDSNGRFSFPSVKVGDYQIRFDAPGLATVPEPFPHPIRFSVEAGKATDVPVHVQLGNYNQNLVEVYIGDGFFQVQPNGTENGDCVVKVGTNICWYNVDDTVHTVTGGPWGDSGDLTEAQAYLWPATTIGTFSYHCKYHPNSEKAILRVTA